MVIDGERSTLSATVCLDARPQHLGGRVEPQYPRMLSKQSPRTWSGQCATTRRNHSSVATRDQFAEDRLLKLAKGLLAIGKEIRNRARRAPFDFAIDVDKVNALERGKFGTDRRLARAHEADEDVGARAHGAAGDQGMRDR